MKRNTSVYTFGKTAECPTPTLRAGRVRVGREQEQSEFRQARHRLRRCNRDLLRTCSSSQIGSQRLGAFARTDVPCARAYYYAYFDGVDRAKLGDEVITEFESGPGAGNLVAFTVDDDGILMWLTDRSRAATGCGTAICHAALPPADRVDLSPPWPVHARPGMLRHRLAPGWRRDCRARPARSCSRPTVSPPIQV